MTKKTKRRVIGLIKSSLTMLTVLGIVAMFVVTGALEADNITVGTYLVISAIALSVLGASVKLYNAMFE